jgi:hypothetical protein
MAIIKRYTLLSAKMMLQNLSCSNKGKYKTTVSDNPEQTQIKYDQIVSSLSLLWMCHSCDWGDAALSMQTVDSL